MKYNDSGAWPRRAGSAREEDRGVGCDRRRFVPAPRSGGADRRGARGAMSVPATPSRPRVHGNVVRALAERILRGEFRPGDTLPNESALQVEFGVSRTALREAVRVLVAKGLLVSRPRIGTQVRAHATWNRLDAEVLAWSFAVAPDLDFVHSLLEARRAIEPAAAELAASRAEPEEIACIASAYQEMARSMPDDLDTCCAADVAFHVGILEASHNIVFRQLSGTISAALGNVFRLSTRLARNYALTLASHEEVLEAIRRGQPEAARAAMLTLLGTAADDLAPLLAARPGAAVAP